MDKQPDTLAQGIVTKNLGYMVQLDGLRAFAVFGVLIHHFLPGEIALNAKLQLGPLGVRLFFVLSGFLITGILLRLREKIDANKQGIPNALKQFYLRRIIRLFPVYYLTLFLTTVFAFDYVKSSLPWHLTYTSNFYFSLKGWDGLGSHFWSLSVEEQFYLIWPLVIFLVPGNKLLISIILVTLLGPISRLLICELGFNNTIREHVFTLTCLDSLGMGAILAFLTCVQNESTKKLKKYFSGFCFWIGVPLFITFNLIRLINLDGIFCNTWVLEYATASIFFCCVINRAAKGFDGIIGSVLENKVIVYLGRISYGIYVYHILVAYLLPYLFGYLGLIYPESTYTQFFWKTTATVLVAILSWDYIEKPINRLKKRFEYN